METPVLIAIIIGIVVIVVVYLLRDRLTDLSVDGKEAKMNVKAKVKETSITDDPPTNVVFKGNKLRGEGEYRMQNTRYENNDADGKQKVELGYDELSSSPEDTDQDN